MWYFRPQQSLRRTDNTSILSSETHEKAALSGRLADVLRLPKGQLAPAGPPAVPWDSRRPAVHSLLRQVFPGQQSPPHIPPFLCCQGPCALCIVQKIHVAVAVVFAEITSLLQVGRAAFLHRKSGARGPWVHFSPTAQHRGGGHQSWRKESVHSYVKEYHPSFLSQDGFLLDGILLCGFDSPVSLTVRVFHVPLIFIVICAWILLFVISC